MAFRAAFSHFEELKHALYLHSFGMFVNNNTSSVCVLDDARFCSLVCVLVETLALLFVEEAVSGTFLVVITTSGISVVPFQWYWGSQVCSFQEPSLVRAQNHS